jgi:hypothetical protein
MTGSWSDHQNLYSGRRGKRELPLAKTVFAFVRTKLRLVPAPAAVAREIDSGQRLRS